MYNITPVGNDSLFIRLGLDVIKDKSPVDVMEMIWNSEEKYVDDILVHVIEEIEHMLIYGLTDVVRNHNMMQPKEIHIVFYRVLDSSYAMYLIDHLMMIINSSLNDDSGNIYVSFKKSKVVMHCSDENWCKVLELAVEHSDYYKEDVVEFDTREEFKLKAPNRNDRYNTYTLSENGITIASVNYG